ncbi:type II secretion system secretin GspD [Azoarcus indigens]|nr:type II secretion system secretin GspD [Azoarcus indigens]
MAAGVTPGVTTTARAGDVEALTPRTAARPAAPARAIPPAATTNPPGQGQAEKATLNFVDADIPAVISALARFLGRSFLVDPRVKGQLTLVSEGEVSADTAYGMLAGALRMRGYAIVDVGEVSRVLPAADARLHGGTVNSAGAGGGMATRTYRLAYESAEAMVPVLKPMIAPENAIVAYAANNTLVITDYVDNLDRIARIIESIDTPTSLDTEVVKLRNGVAADIAALAAELLEGGGDKTRRDIVVTADPRSNSVLIRSSSPARTNLARELILKLDEVQGDPGNLHVVYLRNAQAAYLAGVLRGLLTGESAESAQSGGDPVRAALGAGGMLEGNAGSSSSSTTTSTTSSSSSAGGSATTVSVHGAAGGRSQASGSSASTFSAGGVTVQADATTNTLIIAAPEPMYRSLRRVIDLLDQRRAQVLVESLIVEVTENDAAELGIQWMAGGKRFFGGNIAGGSGLNLTASSTLDLLPDGLNLGIVDGKVNLPGVGEILNLKMLARALQSKGGANILSTPNILTLDNEPASIMVGKTVPFVSGQYVTSGSSGSNNPFQTIQREDIGLKLNIRPQISEGGTVKLDIYQEVSSIDEQSSDAAGIVTNKRALDTSVLLDDGQIMVLGGLMEDSVSTGTSEVPVLGSLPVLGGLFRHDQRQRAKTNLMVFLRPYVIRDAHAGRGLTLDRYNYMRRQQSHTQPSAHTLLRELGAPILPPADVPLAAAPRGLDLRPAGWAATREQAPPATQSSVQARERPARGEAGAEAGAVSIAAAVSPVAGDPAALYAGAEARRSVLQISETAAEDEALATVRRVRISGLQAYVVTGPGGRGHAVRVDVPHDAQAVDTAVALLRELGYAPELVVAP